MKKCFVICSVSLCSLTYSLTYAKPQSVFCSSSADQSIDMELTIDQNSIIKGKTSVLKKFSEKDIQITLTADSKKYEVVVSDDNDTNIFYEFEISQQQPTKDSRLVNKKRLISGNDSDNSYGHIEATGEDAFVCLYK